MNKSLNLIRRLIAWLTERDGPLSGASGPRNWADLPPYHPRCATCD